MIHLILLSGGSGTRLWPLSNNARSKQFLKVLRDGSGNHISMVQRVFNQVISVPGEIDITIATCAAQRHSIQSQIEGEYTLVLEPERRDTAPAIMLACADLAMGRGADEADSVVVVPIDTFASQEYFNSIIALDNAVQSDVAELILLGVKPTFPSEKYGYIIPSASEGEVLLVDQFTEKPSSSIAKRLINRGALWNCGVFAFRLGYLLTLLKRYNPASSFEGIVSSYNLFPKNSFDYEVVEKAGSVAVVPYDGVWKDLGTWNTLTEEMDESFAGRVVLDEDSCGNVHIVNELGVPMVVAGLRNAVVVATPDGILVSDKERSAGIKDLVNKAAEARPMYESRFWGEYRVLDTSTYSDGASALTKELVLKSGKQLSYQRHQYRSEVWTVVSGRGEIVQEGEVIPVMPGSVLNIQSGQLHACRAIEELHIIEVQLGAPLVEEDIERFGNYWE